MTEDPIFLEEGREMSEGEILARVNALYRRSEIVKLHKAAISARIGETSMYCVKGEGEKTLHGSERGD